MDPDHQGIHGKNQRTTGELLDISTLQKKINRKLNMNRAKNIVFFIGDGMNLATIFAARMALGGEEKKVSFEEFPYTGLAKTYCVDAQVPLGDCKAGLDPATHVDSISKWALDAGKSAGLVTTTAVTDASPAAGYAHIADRLWENDFIVRESGCDPKIVKDIARQLIHGPVGSRLSVIMGGGRGHFRDATMRDEEGGYGYRNDSRDLINEWLYDGKSNKYYVWNRKDLLNLPANTERVLGLFEKDHMQYYLESQARRTQSTEPTLEEMTRVGIDILKKNKNGFFLFVEGGKIDLAHHDNLARTAVGEATELHKAVKAAREMLSEEDTLIVVTADHAHAMDISGYPTRGNDIFGEVDRDVAKDGMPYMTLSYTTGTEFSDQVSATGGRVNPNNFDYRKWSSYFPFYVPMDSATHAGDDVAVYASGPFAHLFEGTMEQSNLPYLMAYAACIGGGPKKDCPKVYFQEKEST
uniref:alkaline phosphatase n=1 Tax=Lutzomyia longipalpis TaxID=7200 RepID=A0A1B0CIB1_LUTLO